MATGYCPANCATVTLVTNPTGDCPNTDFRKTSPSRLVVLLCDTTLPNPMTQATMQPLITNGEIAFTSPLTNIAISDPNFADVTISDCIPPVKVPTSQTITAQDRIKVEEKDGTGLVIDKFFDYKVHKSFNKNRMLLRYGVMMCNGDVFLAKDKDGKLLEGSFISYIGYEDLGSGLGKIEVKKIEVSVQGLWMDYNSPDFNVNELGLNIG